MKMKFTFPQRRIPDALPDAHSQRYFLPQENTPHQQAGGISSHHVRWQLRNRTILWSQHFTAANLSLDNQPGETRPACWPIYRSLHQLLVKQRTQLRVTQPATPRQRQFSGMTGDPGLDLTTKSLAEPVHRCRSTCFWPLCGSLTRCRNPDRSRAPPICHSSVGSLVIMWLTSQRAYPSPQWSKNPLRSGRAHRRWPWHVVPLRWYTH